MLVDGERKQFGTRVVADTVHHAFAFNDQRHVNVGDQNPFTVPQRRYKVDAFWRDDRGVATAGDRALHRRIRCDGFNLRLGQPTGSVHDEAAGFGGVMAHRSIDLVGEDLADH